MATSAGFGRVHFATAATPERDRIGIWREVIGRSVLRLDITPLPDERFEADVTLQAMPGLAMLSGDLSGSRSGRTPELLADGVDDLGLVTNIEGPYLISQGGQELVLGDGDATLFSCAEPNGSPIGRRAACWRCGCREPPSRLSSPTSKTPFSASYPARHSGGGC